MKTMVKLTLEEALKRFASCSQCFCDPDYFTTFTPYKCNTEITVCPVCKKEHNRTYLD